MSRVMEMNYTITQKGNRRRMCTYYCCEYPGQIIANMVRCMHLDNAKEESSTFFSLRGKIIVAVGIDKSGKDLVGTVRVCNRRKGNAGLHVQASGRLGVPWQSVTIMRSSHLVVLVYLPVKTYKV